MSFGEHLEELRKALVKAFLWLAAGTAVGLVFANSVVRFIERPLRVQLDEFYLSQTADRFERINNVAPPQELLDWMKNNSVMPERVFIDPAQLQSAAATASAAVASQPAADSRPAAVSPADDAQAADVSTSATQDEPSEPTVKPIIAKEAKPDPRYEEVWSHLSRESVDRLQPILMMRPIPNRLMTYDLFEGFLIWLKAGLLVGAVLASPGIFYHIWEFLAAGLYPHERRYVYLYLPLSILLFIAGVALAFFVIFQLVINFLLTYNTGMDIDFQPRLKEYISIALFLPLGFGVAFQLPIVMLGLNRFGIIPVEVYTGKWRLAVLGIAFLSMVLTPADAYSMIGMFVPLVILYFLGIALCLYMPKGPGLGSRAFDPA